ncbi:MAG: transporter [Ornithinibacter sp.]|jgi:lipooligosaccharide transport system permease protein|nr:transporter [Ornithinibacter sp.]
MSAPATDRLAATAAASGRLDTGPRPGLSQAERLGAVMGHHLLVYRRTWKGSIINRFLSPLFFLLSMGLGLGTLVDDGAGGVDGVPYLQFVVPGIIAVQAMWLSFGESTYAVFGYIRWNQMYAAMLSTPLRVIEVLGGHLAVVGVHLVVATTIFVGVASLFGAFASWWVLLTIPVGLLTGLAFAVPTFALSATLDNDNGFSLLYRFVVTPLMLFSGTFFPVEQLPSVLRPIAWGTPLWHGVELSRDAATGTPPGWLGVAHLGVLLLYIGGGWVLAHRQFSRRLVS